VTGPEHTLAEQEARIHEWLDDLRDREATLVAIREELTDSERTDIPEDVLASLEELLQSLEADLESQVTDLEGDLEMIADLQETFEEVSQPELADELAGYAQQLSTVFEDKRRAIEDLLAATDDLIDRFEELTSERYGE
jgi:methyl-accepting chemotaxis protein